MTCLPEPPSHALHCYEQHLRSRVKPATQIRTGNIVWRFLKLSEGRKSIAEYRPADLRQFRTLRRRVGITRKTINAEADTIRRFFEWTAENNESIEVNPAWRRRVSRHEHPAKPALARAA